MVNEWNIRIATTGNSTDASIYLYLMVCAQHGSKIVQLSIATNIQTNPYPGIGEAAETVRVQYDRSETNIGIIGIIRILG